MRPIVDGLRERITATEIRLADIEEERTDLTGRLSPALKMLLAAEEHSMPDAPEPPTEPMEDYILSLLRRRARSKAEIGEAVEKRGYIKEGQSAGRVVHAKLLHMANANLVQETEDEKYEAAGG